MRTYYSYYFALLQNFISSRIVSYLPFEPNEEQQRLIAALSDFLVDKQEQKLFVLRGYAGTGKTSIVSALVKAMQSMEQKTLLLAPTGRAAKVIASYSQMPAFTIHKKIYRQYRLDDFRFGLTDNLHKHTLFVVDEASMISNHSNDNNAFGTGRLLDDLIEYVYAGHECSLLLLGDVAQLPPVKQENSPALDEDFMQGYGLDMRSFTLTQVARQALESGVLHNATRLRQHISDYNVYEMPHFETQGFPDIFKLEGGDMLEVLQAAYDEVGVENTIVVTRSNKRANLYNQGIRARVMWKEDEISNGDMVMVTRNNYFWTKEYEGIDFLANGDMFRIARIGRFRELYGMRFADVSLESMDYDWEIDTTVLLDSIYTESPDKSYALSSVLFERVAEDYPEIRNRKELVKTIMANPYFNALHIKFAYAVTCHKAQGGQWQRVFIDQGMINDDMLGLDYYRWLYTALTRTTDRAYLIGFKD